MLQDSNIFCHERVSFATFILGTLSLPLFGLVTCVFISSVFHFEDATGTHCQVMRLFKINSSSTDVWNQTYLSPGSQLPAIHQRLHQPEAWVPHMEVLHWTALSSQVPGGVYLLQILQGVFSFEVPGEPTQLCEPSLFCLWEPRPAAPHICVIQWNILWVDFQLLL